ncbi:uncharacterized protein [Battus philenor]|uniref:uncharacterized protein n=1 Tax=Battus philenor TaxID=42288 RepID=UPI0035D0A547
MKSFLVVLCVVAYAAAGAVRDKRGFLGGVGGGLGVGDTLGGDYIGYSAPSAHVVSVDKVVHVPKVVSVPKVVTVNKVVSVPQVVSVNKVVAAPSYVSDYGGALGGVHGGAYSAGYGTVLGDGYSSGWW